MSVRDSFVRYRVNLGYNYPVNNNSTSIVDMPFRRRKYGRYKRRYKKKRYFGKGRSYKNRRLETVLGAIEKKTFDSQGEVDSTTAGVVVSLSDMLQGGTSATREGDKISPVLMWGRFKVSGDDDAAVASHVRIIIFQDKECAGVRPDIGTTVALKVLTTASVTSLFYVKNRVRFKIMFDKDYIVSNAHDEGFPGEKIVDKFSIKFGRNAKVNYLSSIDTDADLGKGALFMLVISDKSTQDYPIVEYNVRLRYYG